MSIEKALKTVYDVHRKSVLESNQNAEKFKNLYERLTEKYKKLQKDYELSSLQKKHFQEAAFNKQNRGGDCCAALRSSLETIGSTYKQLLEEKDARIKYLEDEIKKHRRRSSALGIGSLDFTQDVPLPTATRTISVSSGRLNNQETSPDSTSRIVNNEAGSRNNPANDDEEELMFVERSVSPCQPKLRLQKGRLKRNRYTEDVSPENKRQRQSVSPKSQNQTSHRRDGTEAINDINIPPVIVPDTCQHNLDETLAKLEENDIKRIETNLSDVKKTKESNAEVDGENGVNLHAVQVVPETLAVSEEDDCHEDMELGAVSGLKDDATLKDIGNSSMDVVSDTDESDNEISQATVRERNKQITELSMRSVLKSSDSQRKNSDFNKDKNDGSSKLKGGQNRTKIRDFESRNLLDSPDSLKNTSAVDCEEDPHEYISHKTLNLSGDSEVFELDSDYDEKRDMYHNVSQKFDVSGKNDENVEENDNLSNTNINRKSRKESIREENDGLHLRRSPRKHKEIKYYQSQKRSRKKLDDNSQLTESEIHEMFSSPTSSSNDEADLTVQPCSAAGINVKDPNLYNDCSDVKGSNIPADEYSNQSVDCYNVVPVKDGLPVCRKKIQLMIPRNNSKLSIKKVGSAINDARKNNNLTVGVTDDQSSELKSPSIIAVKQSAADKTSEVVLVSSPSSNSLTDPESPLLLQTRKNSAIENENSTKNRCNTEQTSGWLKARNKLDKDESVSEVKNKNRTNSVNDGDCQNSFEKKSKDCSIGVRKSSRVKPTKVLCQTTLTQSFFSPSRKGQRSKVKDTELDHELQEAIRLSLEEAQNSQAEAEQLNDADIEILDFGTEKENSPPFKRPSVLPRSSLRRKGLRSRQTDSISASDETVAAVIEKEKDTHQVLREVSDNVSSQRRESDDQRLNGSLDPAAELSALCADSNDLPSLPSLDKDFRFEDLNQGRSLPKTSTLAEEDSQEIPSSSRSYKFGTKKKLRHQKTSKEPEESSQQEGRQPHSGDDLDISFDHVPKKKGPDIAHVAVVRKKDERQKLKGHSCRECYQYYKSKGLSEAEIQKQIQDCSRHRAKHMKPDTPPHFWSVGFIDTQECVDRGYMKIETTGDQKKDIPSFRRRRALAKRFKAKNETSMIDSDNSDVDL